jgi:hypothetical protein
MKKNKLIWLKTIVFFCFTSLTSQNVFAFFDIWWKDTTPNGKVIFYKEDELNGITYSTDTKMIYHLSEWYFYKGYTIGKNKKDSLGYIFFASDEIKNKIYQFKNEQSWNFFLKKNNLVPSIHRLHRSSWSMFPVEDSEGPLATFIFIFMIAVLIFIILIISLLCDFVNFLSNQDVSFFSVSSKVVYVIWQIIWKSTVFLGVPLFLVSYLLGAFPQSI